MKQKKLSDILFEKHIAESKIKAVSLIVASEIKVDDKIITNPDLLFDDEKIEVSIIKKQYVSRAAYKLKKAVEEFKINLKDKVCIDAGSSTGGFTDYMIQSGAKKVYAVDSAYNELDWKLRNDSRVQVKERTRISDLELDEKVDFISVDLSLISIKKVLSDILKHLKTDGEMVILIKPQYEAKTEDLPQGGIITDAKIHEQILDDLTKFFVSSGLNVKGIIESPIKGRFGNTEYLAFLSNIFCNN